MVYISVYFGINHTCKYQLLPIIKARVCFSVLLSAWQGSAVPWPGEGLAGGAARSWELQVLCVQQTCCL